MMRDQDNTEEVKRELECVLDRRGEFYGRKHRDALRSRCPGSLIGPKSMMSLLVLKRLRRLRSIYLARVMAVQRRV